MRTAFEIGGEIIPAGTRKLVDLPVSKLSNHTPVTLPVHVLHGLRPGPAMFVSAAIHGDELNGVEVVRRLLRTIRPETISGTLLCIPVINTYGFLARSRYMPDRRDLNRSFPGSPDGSLAARLAHLFLNEVVVRCQIGIDLHTAAVHRVNLPQIRTEFIKRPRGRELADAFGAQVVLNSPERGGSLRKAAREVGVDVLVFEGGEGLRFDEQSIRAGYEGVVNVMIHTGMRELPDGVDLSRGPNVRPPLFTNMSKWIRAGDGGIFRPRKKQGDAVSDNELLGWISNPYEDAEVEVRSPVRGIVVGMTTLPIVNMGDALYHIAWPEEFSRSKPVRDASAESVPDEDEII
jgi:uncharacterized protein